MSFPGTVTPLLGRMETATDSAAQGQLAALGHLQLSKKFEGWVGEKPLSSTDIPQWFTLSILKH